MKTTLFFIRLFAVMLIASFSVIHASTFKVGCRDRSPELIVTKGGCIGPVADVVAMALSRNGHKVEWVTNNWGDNLEAAKQGNLDILLRHSMNKEREEFLSAVAYGYEVREVYYYVRSGINKTIYKIEDLSGLRIGMKEGSFYSQDFADNNTVIKVTYPETIDVAQALEKGEIDAAVTSEAHGLDRIRIVPRTTQAPYTEKFANGRYISFSKNTKAIRHFDKFKAEIEKMVESNEIDDIFNRYGLTPPDQL